MESNHHIKKMIEIKKKERKYFSPEFSVENWSELEKALRVLLDTEIVSAEGLVALIEKSGELSDILEEAFAWKQIRMTQHADDPELAKAQTDFYEFIIAPSQPYFFQLNKKVCESKFFAQLPEERYGHLGKVLKNDIELYREENIPLFVKENELCNKYGEMYSQLTVMFEGEERTLSRMNLVLKDPDRSRREMAWRLISGKMVEKREDFEKLFDELKALRIRIAKNAGFDNYRDYKHKALGRFGYTPEDLERFHEAVRTAVVPVMKRLDEGRREKLGVETLRPWDLSVDLDGKVLHPFTDTEQLLSGTVSMLNRIDPEFGDLLSALAENDFVDLPNRKGKAPGGYNCSLPEWGASFIFMNAVGLQSDVDTLTHETGHGWHGFTRSGEAISEYKNPPMEVAELASMSMELMASDHYDEFYADPADIRKARDDQYQGAISLLPAAMIIDAFQHWIYLHPECSADERDAEYARIKDGYATCVDWTGLEQEKAVSWLRVLHIFEVPFYYIEYALAQLGAIALYKQYKENPQQAVANYKRFTQLGYSKPVPEIYAAAGIKFDFSQDYVEEMVDFAAGQMPPVE
jgi:oligoendopeptidase F